MNEQSDNTREKTLREAQKQIIRSAFFALAALAVIVFACYAWFANNRTVTGEIGSVRLSGSSFELASVGDVSDYVDENNQNIFEKTIGDRAVAGSPWPSSEAPTGTITGQHSDIYWNISTESTHKSDFGNTSEKDSISPGKSGTLRFYVVPQRSGKLMLEFHTQLIPLFNSEIEDETTLKNLLRGHILFTLEQVNEDKPDKLLNFSLDDNFTPFTFQLELDVEENKLTPIPVCLKWEWPYESSDARKAVVNPKIISQNRTCFFYNYGNLTEGDLSESLESFYYNNADQYIGENVSYLIFQLTAEEILSK